MPTKFAPPERLSDAAVRLLAQRITREVLLPWFDAVPVGVLVLDPHRQIVYCNEAFRLLARKRQVMDVLGLRPGEALDCIHAQVEPEGCGCSEFCRLCGAAQAILKSLQGEADCKECRMLRLLDGTEAPLDLQVFTRPIPFEGGTFSLVTAIDISHEKRLRYLERTFYHDMVNLAGGMTSLAEMMAVDTPDENALALFAQCSRRVLGEELYHRDVAAAEAGTLAATPEFITLHPFLERLTRLCRDTTKAEATPVRIELGCGSVAADKRILSHVLRNMLINALEACPDGGVVLLSCEPREDGVRFRVENPGEMPEDILRQLFKRYVSTKGMDRGLGTYVMRLLAEGPLGGKVSAESRAGRTVFTLDL